jgi:transcriptional regulator of arginine metabolism
VLPILHQLSFRSTHVPSYSNISPDAKYPLTSLAGSCIKIQVTAYFGALMNTGKTFRHGQILRLVADVSISNQEELRRRLAAQKLRVTQATLSRDLQELRLVKTHQGYKPAAALPEESNGLPALSRALGEFLQDVRPAENLLVLKTPPGGAQALAAAVDAAKFTETAGTIAGDDTVLIITPDRKSRESLQKKIESLVK